MAFRALRAASTAHHSGVSKEEGNAKNQMVMFTTRICVDYVYWTFIDLYFL